MLAFSCFRVGARFGSSFGLILGPSPSWGPTRLQEGSKTRSKFELNFEASWEPSWADLGPHLGPQNGPKWASKPSRHAGAPLFQDGHGFKMLADSPGTPPRGPRDPPNWPPGPSRARFWSRFGTPSWPILGLSLGFFLGRNFSPTLLPQLESKWSPPGS